MKLEQQVCSLELAKKLKELGVKQGSYFHWFSSANVIFVGEEYAVRKLWSGSLYDIPEKIASAFTVAELGEMFPLNVLPDHLRKAMPNGSWLEVHKENGCWSVKYVGTDRKAHQEKSLFPRMNAETEADARAKMLIYLIGNNLHDPKISNS